jgi:hypothetical protein
MTGITKNDGGSNNNSIWSVLGPNKLLTASGISTSRHTREFTLRVHTQLRVMVSFGLFGYPSESTAGMMVT